MHIISVGLNHKTAPVHIREKMAFHEEELTEALPELRQRKSILECVIVTTCNRMEVYVVCDQLHTGRYYTKAFLSEWFSLDMETFTPYLTIRENEACVEHLFRVTCGLDSMIVGETQILGQIRDQFMLAQRLKATGTIFNELFKQAVTVAKKAHTKTNIDGSAVSVSYAAVELAKKILGPLQDKRVLLIGAGETSQLTAKNLRSNGVKDITVTNRTYEKARELAAAFNGQARPFFELQDALSEADIIISSTSSTSYVVTTKDMQTVKRKRRGRPLFMIDIAVPRDLEPKLNTIENVFLYNIDDLEHVVEANMQERLREAEKINDLIEEAIVQFASWLNTLGVVPLISALRTKALKIQSETMASIERKLPDLSERERKVLRKHTKSIINQLLRDPILGIKEMAADPNADEAMDTFIKLFALEDEIAHNQNDEKKALVKSDRFSVSRATTFKEIPLRS